MQVPGGANSLGHMARKRHTGVARVVPRGRVPVPRTKPDTGVASVPAPLDATMLLQRNEGGAARPVFVDQTGRRRRLLGWVAFLVACLGLLVVGLLWLSQTGSAVGPDTVPTCAANAPTGPTAVDRAGSGCTAPTLSGR